MSEVVFGLHHVGGVEGAFDSGDLFITLVIVELWVFVKFVGELGKHAGVRKWSVGVV